MDNYGEFLQRLNTAADSLDVRQEALSSAQAVVSSALADNEYGLEEWAGRKNQLESLLRAQGADRADLKELHAVATNMESVFRARVERVGGRSAAIQKRIEEIRKPLYDLQVSRARLAASRRVAEEREKLSRAVLDLAGTAEGVATATPDGGLRDDLKAAREAVVLAEALLELKGD